MRMEENMDCKLEEKCEHLMNLVVETRKQFSKMCVNYTQQAALVENNMLKLQLQSISTCRFKSKNVSTINTDEMKQDLNDFTKEMIRSQQRFEDLNRKVADVQSVVLQLKTDAIGKRLMNDVNVEALFAAAKRKNK